MPVKRRPLKEEKPKAEDPLQVNFDEPDEFISHRQMQKLIPDLRPKAQLVVLGERLLMYKREGDQWRLLDAERYRDPLRD